MKEKLFLAANAIVLAIIAIVGSCSYDADPEPAISVDVRVVADGVEYAAQPGSPRIPADTRQVRVVASVKAPPGDWQLSLAAGGALSLQGATAGAVSTTVHAKGEAQAVEVSVTASPEPAGEAVIRASLDTFVKSFRFVVTPVVPTLTLCERFEDGACAAPVEVPDAGLPYIDDAGVAWLPLSQVSPGTLRDGDRAALVISADPSSEREGITWTGTVTTSGVLWLVDGDNPVRSRTVELAQGAGPVVAPVRILGSGVGSAFAAIGAGPQASLFIQTASASVAPRRIEFVGHVGLQAQNRVSLCSTRLSGSLRVSLDLDGGAVFPAQAPLVVTPGGPCVDPTPGQADFVWTGSQPNPIWTVKDELADASTLVAVPALGTDVSVDVTELVVSLLTDAGVDAGGGPSGALAKVSGSLRRNTYGQSAALPGEPLASTDVAVKVPSGVTANPASFKTDTHGGFSFEVTKAAWVSGVSILLEVDHRVSVPIVVEP